MPNTSRNNEVDMIRMVALIGICLVNVPFMALPTEVLFSPSDGWPDKAAAFFIESLFQLKFFLLFSFIFGWGMFIQKKSAQAKGQAFAQRYFRRMLGLAILGAAHAIFVFNGDILLLYAVLGSALWLIQNQSPKSLLKTAAWMLPLSLSSLTLIAIMLAMLMSNSTLSMSSSAYNLGGDFIEATTVRLTEWPVTWLFLLFLQGPLTFGAFALGLAAAKTDFFMPQSAAFQRLQKLWPYLLICGLPLNLLYAAVMGEFIPESYGLLLLFGFIMIAIGAPMLSAVYLYFIIQLARNVKMPELLVLAGRNSLSTYVAQGVLAGLLFGAYGLGYFASFGLAALLPISLGIALTAMLLTGLYAKFLGRGPLEPVLRWISR